MTATLSRLLAATVVATGLVFVGQGGAAVAAPKSLIDVDIDICISIGLPGILGGKPSCRGGGYSDGE